MAKTGMPFLTLLCLLLTQAAPASAAKKADAAESFFGNGKLHTIHIHLSAADWELMQPTRRPRTAPLVADTIPAPVPTTSPLAASRAPYRHEHKPLPISGEKLPPNNFGFEYVYVKAQFECDGVAIPNDVALRFKGNSSYDNFQRSLKRPLKIDFNRYSHDQRFHGLETLNLGNNAFDVTQLREAVSYEVYRRAGVPAPRTTFAIVYLTVDGQYDHEFVGFYTAIEEPDDKPFLKEHFGDAGGLLVKPEGIRGLPYMGETWAPYVDRYHSKTGAPDADAARRFIDFVKLVNYADDTTFNAKIGDYLDVDHFLRYLAATVLITNLDSPLITNHNFYLYANRADGKVWIMPWDMNLAFASYGGGFSGETFNLSIDHPWAGDTNKLMARLMAIPANKEAYHDHLRTCVARFFNEKDMTEIMKPMHAALAKADEAAAAAKQPAVSNESNGGGGRRFGRNNYTLEEYVPKRVESVLAQLDGKGDATFEPRPNNGGGVGQRWGINALAEFGNLPMMAQAVRRAADTDGDFGLDVREADAAGRALFRKAVKNADQQSIDERELATALTPLIADFAQQQQQSRGFFSFVRGTPSAARLWAKAIVYAARNNVVGGDAKLSEDDFAALATRLFCLADVNLDDRLDEREIIEALDLLAHWADEADTAAAAAATPNERQRRRR